MVRVLYHGITKIKGADCSSYKPLSLLGADVKIYAKLLARLLETCMTSLVHCDQTGFLKCRLATDNLRCLLHIIDTSRDDDTPAAVMFLDAVKAFDRLEWSYLWAVMETTGLGNGFILLRFFTLLLQL